MNAGLPVPRGWATIAWRPQLSVLPSDSAPVMRQHPPQLDVEAWARAQVDVIEARIVAQRGPYTPMLSFLDEPAPAVPVRPSPRLRRVQPIEVTPEPEQVAR